MSDAEDRCNLYAFWCSDTWWKHMPSCGCNNNVEAQDTVI